MNANDQRIHGYGLFLAGGRHVRAPEIRAALVARIAKDGDEPGPHDDKATAAVLRIDHLGLHGERYSNQGFDVLSSALDVLRDMGGRI